jgi:hypothetical protein
MGWWSSFPLPGAQFNSLFLVPDVIDQRRQEPGL